MAGDASVSNASNDSQVVIVVGASSGMGRATAKRLAMEGMRVVAFARRAARLAELEDELRANGRTIVTIWAFTQRSLVEVGTDRKRAVPPV